MMRWSEERKRKQAEAIKRWKPWEKSTGAKTPEGKARVSMNSYRGALRPKERALARELRELSKAMEDIFNQK